jgi:hypothetical protein
MRTFMTVYRRLAGDSGVVAYRSGARAIDVEFSDGKVYTYTYDSAGREQVEQMKALAREGRGLCSYISRFVRDGYESVR